MLIQAHVEPSPSGDERGTYEHVEAALRIIETSGLDYMVGALGTSIQGDPDECWALMRKLHEATLESGANSVSTSFLIMQKKDPALEHKMADLAARNID
ncbi:thiamine-binding protein [Canibacter sp. lx-45]|uniref:thiamine-binding protein n=1 Tax=Canibacter zhuwentaonis TaxID=2837491 RepID=UPI001BDC5BBE|nr:thiamine-binding protein [Canibacter zhuwentaonis]MBT1035337.1 thiamine-binding protein [Canibacter zhuwentaonis]